MRRARKDNLMFLEWNIKVGQARKDRKKKPRSRFIGIVRATESEARKRASHRKHLYHQPTHFHSLVIATVYPDRCTRTSRFVKLFFFHCADTYRIIYGRCGATSNMFTNVTILCRNILLRERINFTLREIRGDTQTTELFYDDLRNWRNTSRAV